MLSTSNFLTFWFCFIFWFVLFTEKKLNEYIEIVIEKCKFSTMWSLICAINRNSGHIDNEEKQTIG